MTGQRTLRNGTLGRAAIGLLAVAALVLLAPVAAATPETDANDAINAAYDAGGGPTGPLGPKDGDVYPVGAGFGQNLAGGKIFFTPATGAHAMTGAILEKYESLGGPADGDLGFPTIDEGPGRAPDSRNTTFSAPDNPVIFWTPGTGARVVRGAINAAWDKLGGSAGVLGVPAEDEEYRGPVVTQKFTGGELSYDAETKAFTTVPPELAGQLEGLAVPDDPVSAISAARRAAGGPLGPLGAAQGEPYEIGADGLGQDFAGGKIFYSPETGANVVTGQVLAKYESVGGPEGDLGFPITSETDGGIAPASRMSTFAADDKPVIFWTPDYGAVIVRGAMNAAWEKLGGATGDLGAPMADQTENGNVVTQRFSGGVVSWDSSTKKFSTEPPNLASALSGLQVPGQDVPKAPSSPRASDTNGGKGFEFQWWWLLGLVPILLVVLGLIAFAVLRNRRKGDDTGSGPAYGTEPSAAATDDDAALFADRYAREGLASLPSASAATDDGDSRLPLGMWDSPGRTGGDTAAQEDEEDPDKVDTAPTRIESETQAETPVVGEPPAETPADNESPADTPVESELSAEPRFERDPLTDTGRHARIVIDEPEPPATTLRMPLDNPDEVPEGYPIKADTKSGLYWAPGSSLYDDARAEIWFSSEEFARTNGFVRAD